MKNINRKGFTIVELVIVVAVIAVLAAVLIPTFAGIIEKANLTADQRGERDMNTALAIAGNPDNLDAAIDALIDNGFNGNNLVPVSKDYSFVWNESTKKIELVKTDEIVDGQHELEEAGVKYIDIVVNDTASLESALTNGVADIKLDANVELSYQVVIPAGSKVTLDLNGKTLSTAKNGDRSKYLDVSGELVISNGTVDARGIEVLSGGKLVIAENANVEIANVDSNGGAAIWVYAGGEVEVSGGTFTAMNGVKWSNGSDIRYNPGVINNSGKVTINGGTFKSAETICYLVQNSGEMVINGGTFEGTHGVVANSAGTTTINGGSFTLKPYADGSFDGHVVYASGGNVVISENSTATFGGHDSIFYENGGTITDNR